MKTMKLISQFLILALFSAIIMVSCQEEEGGQPVINNVRVTEKDSTITGGAFNLTVAIQGIELGSVQKVFFNDVETYLNPTYVTETNIICNIPDEAPTVINNKITVVTSGGMTATYDFTVILPEPIVQGVYNEFAMPGSENKVLGNYFYVISSVLVGSTEVEITKITPTEITFLMPPNAVSNETITVVGDGGTVTPIFKLHPTEGNMVNFDIPATGWGSDVCWGSAERVDPGSSDLEVISGRYTRIKQTNLAASGWQDDWVISTCYFEFGLPAGSADTKMFKFEANVVEAWKAGFYEINITAGGVAYKYIFKPWNDDAFKTSGFSTKGWRTMYIPLSEFKSDSGAKIADISKITDFQYIFKTPDSPIDRFYVAADNFRIVDK